MKRTESSNPTLPNYPKVDAPSNPKPHRTVDILFDGVQDPTSPAGVAWRLNKKSHWKEPIFTFNEGDVVQMTLRNANAQPHPFHLHGQFFKSVHQDFGVHDENMPQPRTVSNAIHYTHYASLPAHMHVPAAWGQLSPQPFESMHQKTRTINEFIVNQ